MIEGYVSPVKINTGVNPFRRPRLVQPKSVKYTVWQVPLNRPKAYHGRLHRPKTPIPQAHGVQIVHSIRVTKIVTTSIWLPIHLQNSANI